VSKATVKFNPPIDIRKIFPLSRYHPHYSCRVEAVRVETRSDGSSLLFVSTETGCFIEEMDTGIVGVANERPL